jgi:cysteine desulfuration protein SufE
LWIIVDKKTSLNNEIRYFFTIDSDSNIVKGLADLILGRVNGLSKEKIKKINFELFFDDLSLKKYLSESRVSGVQALIKFVSDC